jgi:hypothetical protein
MRITLDHLRRYAVARSLFKPTTLGRAIGKLGFVQADPIRAPARAQDLTLRHRVVDYHAGDLERRYPRAAHRRRFLRQLRLSAPRAPWTHASAPAEGQVDAVAHSQRPCRFGIHSRTRTRASPRRRRAFRPRQNNQLVRRLLECHHALLDDMHYRGLIRVARREGGTRIYAARPPAPRPAIPRRRTPASMSWRTS